MIKLFKWAAIGIGIRIAISAALMLIALAGIGCTDKVSVLESKISKLEAETEAAKQDYIEHSRLLRVVSDRQISEIAKLEKEVAALRKDIPLRNFNDIDELTTWINSHKGSYSQIVKDKLKEKLVDPYLLDQILRQNDKIKNMYPDSFPIVASDYWADILISIQQQAEDEGYNVYIVYYRIKDGQTKELSAANGAFVKKNLYIWKAWSNFYGPYLGSFTEIDYCPEPYCFYSRYRSVYKRLIELQQVIVIPTYTPSGFGGYN